MHRTISASLHAGICTVREAPSQMDLLVRALPGSPLPTARGALLAAPKPCCGAGDMRAPPVLLAHPPCYDGTSIMPHWHIHHATLAHPPCHIGTLPTTTALPTEPSHAPVAGAVSCIVALAQGDVLHHHPHPCLLKPCTQSPAVLMLPRRDPGTRDPSQGQKAAKAVPTPSSSHPHGTQLPSLPTTQSTDSERSLNAFSCKTDSWRTPVSPGE